MSTPTDAPSTASTQSKQLTAWHPPFVAALRAVLPADAYQIIAELQLNHQPQRIDVIVRLLEALPPPLRQALAPLVRHLGRVTAIEFKGPTAVLRGEDLLVILGYAFQYRVQHGVARCDMSLIIVANRLTGPFRDAVTEEGGSLVEESPGVHVASGLAYPLCVIETSRAEDHVLLLFSQLMVKNPSHLFTLLNEEERAIFRMVYREVKRLREDPGSAMKYPDAEEMTMSMEELMDEILDDAPKEKMLNRLSPEDMLKRLSPEDMLKRLSPEDMLKRLSPEDRLRGLSPEERLRGLSPEDMLRRLSTENLTPELREQLKKLLS